MIALWMGFALFVGIALSIAALVAERLNRGLRRPARFVWMAAIVTTALWPFMATVVGAAHHTRSSTHGTIAVPRARPDVSIDPTRISTDATMFDARMASVAAVLTSFARTSWRTTASRFDIPLVLLWIAASLVLLARWSYGIWILSRTRRAWRTMHVDGALVRVSHDVGPAVVGVTHSEVVIPEWVLGFDPTLRALILRHESEHQRSRDPFLWACAALLVALLPWNLILLWQARRLRLAIEVDCDERVLRAHPHAERYGMLLLALAQRRAHTSFVAGLALSERTSHLERRISAMRRTTVPVSLLRIAGYGAAIVAAIAVTALIESPVHLLLAQQRPTYTPPVVHVVTRTTARDTTDTTGSVDSTSVIHRKSTPTQNVRLGKYESGVDVPAPEWKSVRYQTTPADTGVADRSWSVAIDTPAVVPARFAYAAIDTLPVYSESDVTTPAQLIKGSTAPAYPSVLKSAGVEGEVHAQYIIDTTGRVVPGSLKILSATNELFSAAVRHAVPSMRYSPATLGNRRIRESVVQAFVFSLPPAKDTVKAHR